MRFSVFSGLLFAAACSAKAIPSAIENSYAVRDLTWTGQVRAGEPAIKLTGTAQTIYRRILEINPNYDVEFGIRSEKGKAAQQARSIAKRAIAPTSDDYTCAYGTYVDVTPIAEGIQSLYAIGTGICTAPAGVPGDGGCTRLTCSSNAGIWLCNDDSVELETECGIAADNAVEVLIQCQQTVYAGNQVWDSTVRGQIFSGNHEWNVIINTDTAGC
ncbi:hypothetical protein BX600DRAFT_517592 [Xylariales sp. PMI_506]|nr:hypothetical protein BX600DRAFT_517592 [Xylariales sp. PMI_506]